MANLNSFRITGRIYGTPRKIINLKKETIVRTIVCVQENGKVEYIPIVFIGVVSEKAWIFCRPDNVVSVSGRIFSKYMIDRTSGVGKIEVSFLAEDIMLITKARRSRISHQRFSDLIKQSNVEDYEPPRIAGKEK